MRNFAIRLMGYQQNTQPSSTILGHVINWLPTNRSRLRIGLWPIRSESAPEIAMGLAALFGFLMERWQSVRVYRLFAAIKGQPSEYEWTINQSQFEVDDWELDGLDENVAIWGSLELVDTKYLLKLEVENDLAEGADGVYSETCKSGDLADLLGKLPQIAENIADYLVAGDTSPIMPIYKPSQWDELDLQQVLTLAFEWELKLFLALWGKPWPDDQLFDDYRSLLEVSTRLDSDLGDWIMSNTAARVLSPLYSPFGESFLDHLDKTEFDIKNWWIYSLTVALSLYRSGYAIRAYDLLEESVNNHPDSAVSWLALAELYTQAGDPGAAVDTFQRAIKIGATSTTIYRRYAELLLALDSGNIIINVGARRISRSGRAFVEDFALINPENVPKEQLLYEATLAYRAALELESGNAEILAQLLVALVDIRDDSFWDQFERLVELDPAGDYVRDVLETMYSFDDMTPVIRILSAATIRYPNRVDIRLNLARAYLLDEQDDAARVELEKARNLNKNREINAEIDRLMLSAADPDLEAHLGEITDTVNAGNEVRIEDIEFLEDVVAKAPAFIDGYILLANAYLNWGETTDALNILLDGQKQLPDNPDVAGLLARVLWQLGETQMAFDCLNKSLFKNPNYVPLLALMGRLLFDDRQEERAKIFLLRAESLDPLDSMLTEVRVFIANMRSSFDAD